MKLSSAEILRKGKGEIRAIGDVCDFACFTWYACANSKPSGTCAGFVLRNGETRKHLNRILNEDDGKYVESCMSTIQRGCNEETREAMVQEIQRFIPPEESEPTPRETGVGYMAQCALGIPNVPTSEHTEPEPTSNSEFGRMLKAARGESAQAHTTTPKTVTRMMGLFRQIDESLFPELCDPQRCPPDFARHCRANREDHYGQPCIYKTLTNEELRKNVTR
jgi:hypothetical protein